MKQIIHEDPKIDINSIVACIHDTSFGGYPYKVVVSISLDVKTFDKLCPKIGQSKQTICGRTQAPRDLGSLVIWVNNLVYDFNQNIPAHNPSIDSNGHKRAKNGIKTMEFVYFFKDADKAERLGFEVKRFKNGETYTPYRQFIELK